MYRVEAKNFDDEFELIELFDSHQKERVKEFIKENDNYFLRVIKCGSSREIVFENF